MQQAVKDMMQLDFPNESGITQREILESAAAQAGKVGLRAPEIKEPHIPIGYERLWQIFMELSSTRPRSDMGGVGAISNQEIESFCRLNGERLSRFDMEAIRRMDAAYLKWLADNRRKK